jgi:hypothetical protein
VTRWIRGLGWLILLLVAFLANGPVGAATGLAVWLVFRYFGVRVLLWVGVGAWALVPVVVLANGLPDPGAVTPAFVGNNLVAHHLAFGGLVALVLGVVVEEWNA